MKNAFHVRPAELKDCPRMFELIHELATFERLPHEVTVPLAHFEASGFGKNPVWWGFVAENEQGHIVGMAVCYIRYSTWKGQSLYLEDIIVTERYRRQGIGRLLFDAVKEDGTRRGFKTMSWQVLEWNIPAIEFYDSYGAAYGKEWYNCTINL